MLQLVLECGYFHLRPVFTFVIFLNLIFTDDGYSEVQNVEKIYYFRQGLTVFNQFQPRIIDFND